jgi:outer membrane protein assembly factor BamE (lipoprotein component of BamABCDE complex)
VAILGKNTSQQRLKHLRNLHWEDKTAKKLVTVTLIDGRVDSLASAFGVSIAASGTGQKMPQTPEFFERIITRSNLEKLKPDMSEAELVYYFGAPTKIDINKGRKTLTWGEPGKKFLVAKLVAAKLHELSSSEGVSLGGTPEAPSTGVVTQANMEKLYIGMKEQEAVAVLGQPSKMISPASDSRRSRWEDGKKFLEIDFHDGVARSMNSTEKDMLAAALKKNEEARLAASGAKKGAVTWLNYKQILRGISEKRVREILGGPLPLAPRTP